MRAGCKLAIAGTVALAALLPARAQAQDSRNIASSEFKLGIWDHDPIRGVEHGVDVNPELIIASPVTEDMIANAPWWLYWTLQPRPTIGASFNTSGETNQYYVGATWTWMLLQNIINPGDGIVFSYFFGPGFNDGQLNEANPHRKALGSHILFRPAAEIGYQINPTWQVSAYIDHISNGGFAKYNQSINDLGLRLGYHF